MIQTEAVLSIEKEIFNSTEELKTTGHQSTKHIEYTDEIESP
jgi:hypothetical protein